MDTAVYDDAFTKQYENEHPFHNEEEREHFLTILTAYKYYKTVALQRVSKKEAFINGLPPSHQRRLQSYTQSLLRLREAILHNNSIIMHIIQDAETIFFNVSSDQVLPSELPEALSLKTCDVDKVQSVLKQVVRDWSSAGEEERRQCYLPIVQHLQRLFPDPSGVSVLVPGAGLGRLAYEIAMLGFICQGNEFSLYMLFASNFVLNKCHEVNKYTIHPWAHQYVNNLTCEDQLRSISFPDTNPAEMHNHSFSMVAGDFTKVYTSEAEWDCVATCFFIDCAPNVIDFVETIYLILKPGGVWINLGPLLYHYSDMDNEDSIEPPFDVLCKIIEDVGFQFEMCETAVKTKYSQNPTSMLQHHYNSLFFVCRKPVS